VVGVSTGASPASREGVEARPRRRGGRRAFLTRPAVPRGLGAAVVAVSAEDCFEVFLPPRGGSENFRLERLVGAGGAAVVDVAAGAASSAGAGAGAASAGAASTGAGEAGAGAGVATGAGFRLRGSAKRWREAGAVADLPVAGASLGALAILASSCALSCGLSCSTSRMDTLRACGCWMAMTRPRPHRNSTATHLMAVRDSRRLRRPCLAPPYMGTRSVRAPVTSLPFALLTSLTFLFGVGF